MPTEDLEDLNLIKKNYETIEQYNFTEIISKYDLKDSIITLIFKNQDGLRILSRITHNENIVLKKEKAEIQKHISLLREKRELLFSEKNRLENEKILIF